MSEPIDDKTVVNISQAIKLVLTADTIKIRDREGASGRQGVVIQLSLEQAAKICEAVTAKQNGDCFQESSEPPHPFELLFEERQA